MSPQTKAPGLLEGEVADLVSEPFLLSLVSALVPPTPLKIKVRRLCMTMGSRAREREHRANVRVGLPGTEKGLWGFYKESASGHPSKEGFPGKASIWVCLSHALTPVPISPITFPSWSRSWRQHLSWRPLVMPKPSGMTTLADLGSLWKSF